MKKNSNSSTINSTYTDFVRLFCPDYLDKTDNKTDNKTDDKANNKADNEEIDTTIMPDLETEESAAKRRKQEEKGLKILTPNQMLSRLPISLAQLEAGNKILKNLKMN